MCLNDKTCCQNMSLCWYFCQFKIFWRYFYRLFFKFKFPDISKVNLTANLNTHFHWLNVMVNCIIGYHNIHSNDTSMFVPSVYHILCKQAEHRSFDNGDESSETFRNTLIYVNKIWKVKKSWYTSCSLHSRWDMPFLSQLSRHSLDADHLINQTVDNKAIAFEFVAFWSHSCWDLMKRLDNASQISLHCNILTRSSFASVTHPILLTVVWAREVYVYLKFNERTLKYYIITCVYANNYILNSN